MTVLWLIVWLCCSTPELHDWNNWATALLVCIVIDMLGLGTRGTR